jgi:ABC-type transport system involved in multi-copper enzyme maturation permease subunit
MMWLAQVPHVMAKDVRQSRWMLLAYFALVGVATLVALQPPLTTSNARELSMVVVMAVGTLIVAALVQADSPVRSDAFWASRPLHPTAVLTAKVMAALLLVVGIPLLAQIAVLVWNGLSGIEVATIAGRSAWIYAFWLLVGTLVAAVTRDLRSFITAMILVLVGALLVASSVESYGVVNAARTAPAVASTFIGVAGAACAFAALLVLYRNRSNRHLTWAAIGAAVPCLLVGLFWTPQRPVAIETRAAPPTVTTTPLKIDVRLDPAGVTSLFIVADSAPATNRLLMLDMGTATLRLRDGRQIHVPIGSGIVLERPKVPIGDGTRWVGAQPAMAGRGSAPARLTRQNAEAIKRGVTGAWIDGTLWSIEPRVDFTLPFRLGESRRANGQAVDIVPSRERRGEALATVIRSWIRRTSTLDEDRFMISTLNAPRYVLVNRARSEAVAPNEEHGGSSSGALVLPGAWRMTETTRLLGREARYGEELPVDRAWVGQADLVVLDWARRFRGRARVPATLVQHGHSTGDR